MATIKALALSRVQELINKALDYDPASLCQLETLAGRQVRVDITTPPLSLMITFLSDGRIDLYTGDDEQPADLVLTGSAPALARLAVDSGDRVNIQETGVNIRGDHEVLQTLRHVSRNLDIDWEAALAPLIGDVPARLLHQGLDNLFGWQKAAMARSFSGISDYVREEARLAASGELIRHWNGEVDRLSQDTDRLNARVAKLKKRLSGD